MSTNDDEAAAQDRPMPTTGRRRRSNGTKQPPTSATTTGPAGPRGPVGPAGPAGPANHASHADGEPVPVGLWASMAVLLRRWKTVAAGVVLTVVAALMCFSLLPPTYKAMGTMVLLAPTQLPTKDSDKTPDNPYLSFGGSLNAMAEVLITEMINESADLNVKKEGGSGKFKVDQLPGDAPIIRIEATGDTPEEALLTQKAVAKTISDNLGARQKNGGASLETSIHTNTLSEPTTATPDSGSRIRALAGITVLGLVGTICLAFGVESLSQYRAQRAADRGRGDDADDALAQRPEPTSVIDLDELDDYEDESDLDYVGSDAVFRRQREDSIILDPTAPRSSIKRNGAKGANGASRRPIRTSSPSRRPAPSNQLVRPMPERHASHRASPE